MHRIKFTFLKAKDGISCRSVVTPKKVSYGSSRKGMSIISQNYIFHTKFSQFACVFTIVRKFDIHFLRLP